MKCLFDYFLHRVVGWILAILYVIFMAYVVFVGEDNIYWEMGYRLWLVLTFVHVVCRLYILFLHYQKIRKIPPCSEGASAPKGREKF